MSAQPEPCRAGFDPGCTDMRAAAIRKHPRTPRLAECRHYPIPAERPDKLQGPEIGTLCLYQGRNDPSPMVVRVLERSYVWAPGERSASRRYDLKVIARAPNGTRRLLVDDKDLVALSAAESDGFTEGMVLA